jgi:hypothetical protein
VSLYFVISIETKREYDSNAQKDGP